MFYWEIKKILFKNKGIYVIIAAILLNVCVFAMQDRSIAPNVSTAVYMSYIHQYQGKLNPQKEASIETEYDRVSNSKKYISQLQEQFQEGKISEVQLQNKSKVYVQKKANLSSFQCFYNQYLTAKKSVSNRYLLNTRGWDVLFNDSITPIILLLLAICIAVPNFSKEYEKDMDQIQLCCENGRTKLFLVKLGAAAILLIVTTLLISILDFTIAYFVFDLRNFFYPLQSLALYNGSHFSLSLLSAYILSVVLKLLAIVFVSVFSSFISIAFRNQIVASITSLFVNIFSFLTIWEKTAFTSLPIPGNLLFSTEYIKGDISHDVIVSGALASKKVFVGLSEGKLILLLVIVCILLVLFLLFSQFLYLQKKVPNRFRKLFLCAFIPLLLTGCTSNIQRDTSFIYNGQVQNEVPLGKEKIKPSNDYHQILLMNDHTTTNILQDPLFTYTIECMFVHGQYCYYAYHVMDILCFAKVNMKTFENTLLYHSGEVNQQDYFDLQKMPVSNTINSKIPTVISMFSDSRYIYYFLSDETLRSIDLQTNKQTILASDANAGYANYYYYGKIYYINTINQLVYYDTLSNKIHVIPHVYVDSFKISHNRIVYTDIFTKKKNTLPLNASH